MLPSSVTRVKKSRATGDTLTFTAASVHTSFNNNIELRLGHVLKSFFGCFPVCYSANWLFPKSMLFSIIAGLCSSRARWPLVPNLCPWATRKSLDFSYKSRHPRFYNFRALGSLQLFSLVHSLAS